MTELSHLDAQGRARMVDVGDKDETERRARAAAQVTMSAGTLAAIEGGGVPKGDVIAVARLAGESWHRVQAICQRYVDLALARADLSSITRLAIDETSSRRGHNYLTFAADAEVSDRGGATFALADAGDDLKKPICFTTPAATP